MFKTLVRSLALTLCFGLPIAGPANAAVMTDQQRRLPGRPCRARRTGPIRLRRRELLLVSQWLARAGLVSMRLRVPDRLRVGRRLRLERLARRRLSRRRRGGARRRLSWRRGRSRRRLSRGRRCGARRRLSWRRTPSLSQRPIQADAQRLKVCHKIWQPPQRWAAPPGRWVASPALAVALRRRMRLVLPFAPAQCARVESMITRRELLAKTALTATAAPLLGSAGARANNYRPGFLAGKGIAEEGFIYGLPIVMNYTVMYQFSVDRNRSIQGAVQPD